MSHQPVAPQMLPSRPQVHLSTIEQQIEAEIMPKRPPAVAQFYLHATRDAEASTEGVPVWKDAPYISVKIPDEHDFVSRPVTPEDKKRWPQEWAHFEATQGKAELHLRTLPTITPARFYELIEMEIRTVQQLAAYEGPLSEVLTELRGVAQRVLQAIKPRYKVIDGKMERVA